MKIIHPHKVTGQLLDIIHEAEKELVIVSPYVNFRYWQKPVTAIQQAIARGVKVDFYIRLDYDNPTSKEQVQKLGITPILVENLHAKIYYNDHDGIITSMNLLHSSDSNSIEIGCQVEAPAELDELRRIVHRFLAHYKPTIVATLPDSVQASVHNLPFDESVTEFLTSTVDADAYAEWDDEEELTISALHNSFTLYINPLTNQIELSGIITQREANRFKDRSSHHLGTLPLSCHLIPGDQDNYNRIGGIHPTPVTTTDLDQLPQLEKEPLLTNIASFIKAVRAFKDDYK